MTVTRTSYTCAKVGEIYRMGNCQYARNSSQSRDLVKQGLRGKSDTVQFSQEALDRLELLVSSRMDDTLEEKRTIQEEDSKLEKSLKMLEMDADASVDEIRKAYLHAIQHYHPDKHAYLPPEFRKLAEVRTKQINESYATLIKLKSEKSRTRSI